MSSRNRSGSRRWHRLACGAVVTGALLSVTSPAAAQETLAASCPGPPESQSFVDSNRRAAHTFVPQTSGPLTSAQVVIEEPGGTSGDYTVQIVATAGNTPTNTVLASTTLSDASVPAGPSTVTATFATPTTVVAGQQYALLVTRSGAFSIGARTFEDCDGAMWGSPDQTGSFIGLAIDMVFAVFVVPPSSPDEPSPEPAPKADGTLTIDANKGKVAKGRKVTLSGQLDVAANESCEDSRTVEIQRRFKSESDSEFATFTSVQMDDDGNYSLKIKVKKTYFYRAVVGETDACDDETSSSQKVRVQKKKAAQEA